MTDINPYFEGIIKQQTEAGDKPVSSLWTYAVCCGVVFGSFPMNILEQFNCYELSQMLYGAGIWYLHNWVMIGVNDGKCR